MVWNKIIEVIVVVCCFTACTCYSLFRCSAQAGWYRDWFVYEVYAITVGPAFCEMLAPSVCNSQIASGRQRERDGGGDLTGFTGPSLYHGLFGRCAAFIESLGLSFILHTDTHKKMQRQSMFNIYGDIQYNHNKTCCLKQYDSVPIVYWWYKMW